MARTPEARVKHKVKLILVQYEDIIYQNWPVPIGYGAPMLDCIGSIRGRSFAIETKAPGEKPTPRQLSTMRAMKKGGVKLFLIDGAKWPYAPLEIWLAQVHRSRPV